MLRRRPILKANPKPKLKLTPYFSSGEEDEVNAYDPRSHDIAINDASYLVKHVPKIGISPLRYLYVVAGTFGGCMYIKIGQTKRHPLERFYEFHKTYACDKLSPIMISLTTWTDTDIENILETYYNDVYRDTKEGSITCGETACKELYRYTNCDKLLHSLYEVLSCSPTTITGCYAKIVYLNAKYNLFLTK